MSRRRPPPRCQYCHEQVRFLWISLSTGTRKLPFDHDAVDGRTPELSSTGYYPVLGGRAWDLNEVIAEVQVMHGSDVGAAVDEVHALPWHRLHRCPQRAAASRTTETTT